MLRKTARELLFWMKELLRLFSHAKTVFLSQSILRLKDLDVTFVLRIGASTQGLGDVVLQYRKDFIRTVDYASKKTVRQGETVFDCGKGVHGIECCCM